MKLNVTHFFQRAPERDDWIPLPFVTRKINSCRDSYFWGFETFREIPSQAIKKQLRDKVLKPLSWPVAISPGQVLWLTPNNEIYLASEDDPVGDQHKLMVESAGNAAIPEDTWGSGDAFKKVLRSPVTKSIFENGKLNYVFGDYLTSAHSPNNGAVYCPEWQNKALSLAIDDLEKAGKTQGRARHLKLERWQEQEHRYRHIEELIVNEHLPIHWELIFKTWSRAMTIDVIHLANVYKLALVFVRNSPAQKKLGYEDQKAATRNFEEWIRDLNDTQTEVCAPTDQASEHLLLHAITKRKLNREKKTERPSRELKDWILDDPQKRQRVVVCDIGIAHRLKTACANQAELVISYAPYDTPIPAGIAHKKDDSAWRNFLLREIKMAAKSGIAKIRSSFEDTKSRCEKLGMKWVWRN